MSALTNSPVYGGMINFRQSSVNAGLLISPDAFLTLYTIDMNTFERMYIDLTVEDCDRLHHQITHLTTHSCMIAPICTLTM
jgi:hypothetical protein